MRRRGGAAAGASAASSRSYRSVWLWRRAVMHFPRMSREVLMFPASFSLSPTVWVLVHLSEPARSHRENLQRGGGAQNRPAGLCRFHSLFLL